MLVQSAKTNLNVEEVFFSIARDIKQRLADTDSKAEVYFITIYDWLSCDFFKKKSLNVCLLLD